jgi:hypothetical protein
MSRAIVANRDLPLAHADVRRSSPVCRRFANQYVESDWNTIYHDRYCAHKSLPDVPNFNRTKPEVQTKHPPGPAPASNLRNVAIDYPRWRETAGHNCRRRRGLWAS